MDPTTAMKQLTSKRGHDRLMAGRYLARNATPDMLPALSEALRREKDRWVRSSLTTAIRRSLGDRPKRKSVAQPAKTNADSSAAQSIAVRQVSQMLLHEIKPIVGELKLNASREVPDYSASDSKHCLDRMESLISAIERLNQAARSPRIEEFDLPSLAEDLVEDKSAVADGALEIRLIGPRPLAVFGDRSLIKLILINALRNAIESTISAAPSDSEPLVMSWGDTDVDTWVTILDRGVGLPLAFDRAFEFGETTKSNQGHQGMGLAIAKQASDSIDGTVDLLPRDGGGAAFALRWPHTAGQR